MHIVREPKVTLIAKTTFLAPEHIQVNWQGQAADSEKLAEFAGRNCYLSWNNPANRTNAAYLHNILEQAHGSVLEHPNFTFLFEQVSRSLTHELIRHRAGFGYSELSQRYVSVADIDFVEPDLIASDPEAHQLFTEAIASAQAAYTALEERLSRVVEERFSDTPKTLRRKIARQAARSVMPNATETKIVATANVRAWRHFIELRGSEHAEVEIRKLAVAVLKVLQQEAPNLFGDYTLVPLPDGTFATSTQYRKV